MIYNSSWDDPVLVIFKNDSYRKVIIEIDGQKPIILRAYGATADLCLGVGERRARLVIEKPTATHGIWEVINFLKSTSLLTAARKYFIYMTISEHPCPVFIFIIKTGLLF
jgi:hypothetical protein